MKGYLLSSSSSNQILIFVAQFSQKTTKKQLTVAKNVISMTLPNPKHTTTCPQLNHRPDGTMSKCNPSRSRNQSYTQADRQAEPPEPVMRHYFFFLPQEPQEQARIFLQLAVAVTAACGSSRDQVERHPPSPLHLLLPPFSSPG